MDIKKSASNAMTLAAVLLLFGSPAFAEYELKAFSGVIAYEALIDGKIDVAVSTFDNRRPSRLDYFELTNLCVAQVMAGKYDSAIASCEAAIDDLDSYRFVSGFTNRTAASVIFSNLGVARAMKGDLIAANDNLETALSFNPRNREATRNIDQVSQDLMAVADND